MWEKYVFKVQVKMYYNKIFHLTFHSASFETQFHYVSVSGLKYYLTTWCLINLTNIRHFSTFFFASHLKISYSALDTEPPLFILLWNYRTDANTQWLQLIGLPREKPNIKQIVFDVYFSNKECWRHRNNFKL